MFGAILQNTATFPLSRTGPSTATSELAFTETKETKP